tara:strand:+ start:3293 stop:3730 length:438 start_codon:yes stop_codon:yes gene_type:complete
MEAFPESVLDLKNKLSVYCLSVHGENFVLSPGLCLKEFSSRCGQDQVIVSQIFLQMYAVLREKAGRIQINRGYSSWLWHLEHVYKGTPKEDVPELSYHLFGMAADMVPLDIKMEEFAQLCKDIGFGGVKNYGGFVHADSGKKRTW